MDSKSVDKPLQIPNSVNKLNQSVWAALAQKSHRNAEPVPLGTFGTSGLLGGLSLGLIVSESLDRLPGISEEEMRYRGPGAAPCPRR